MASDQIDSCGAQGFLFRQVDREGHSTYSSLDTKNPPLDLCLCALGCCQGRIEKPGKGAVAIGAAHPRNHRIGVVLVGGAPLATLQRLIAIDAGPADFEVRKLSGQSGKRICITPLVARLKRAWERVLAHIHGQRWNASEVSRSLQESHDTVQRHLGVLTAALMIRQLQPWHENVGKRQVKVPKIYMRDSGVFHALMGFSSYSMLEASPQLGASWEGFAVEEILQHVGERRAYFWATQSGAELDLLLMIGGRRIGVEVKYADAPSATKSMHVAMSDLSLDRLYVVYPGSESYDLDRKIRVVPLTKINSLLSDREM